VRTASTIVAVSLVVLGALAGCSRGRAPAAIVAPDAVVAPNAVVERVVDGDTLTVRIGGGTHTARLIGIDTPETVDPRRPVGCFGPEASARATELLPAGTPVQLQLDVEARDHFGRLLVYAIRSSDGVFVNADLARTGHAEALEIEPNTAHSAAIAGAVAMARAERLGLWSACADP
jgi:micrococcal nuclease